MGEIRDEVKSSMTSQSNQLISLELEHVGVSGARPD